MSSSKQKKSTKSTQSNGQSEFEELKEQWTKIIVAASDKAPDKLQPYLKQAAPFIATIIAGLIIVRPHVVKFWEIAFEFYKSLPEKVLRIALGILLCFFGGVFPATIAAVEAFKVCGGPQAMKDLEILYEQATRVKEANKEDDEKDEDNDGIADVKQIDGQQLILRKISVAMKATDPQAVNAALANLYVAWAGVIATLKLSFARTVTLSIVMTNLMYQTFEKHFQPILIKKIENPDITKWVPVLAKWIARAIGVSIAWWIQRTVSAVHSATRGGVMAARNLLELLKEKDMINFDIQHSWHSEIAGYTLALIGFAFQWKSGFGVPLIFKLFVFPVQIVEKYVEWQVSR